MIKPRESGFRAEICSKSALTLHILGSILRVTSLIRNRAPLGPYSRPMPRVQPYSGPMGVVQFLMSEEPLYLETYLAHKKTPTPLGPPRTLGIGYGRVLEGCVFS